MELLTGKAKEVFVKHVANNTKFFIEEIESLLISDCKFDKIHVKALIINWFEAKGIVIGRDDYKNWWLQTHEKYSKKGDNYFYFKDLKSEEKAIKKANEIFNSKF